MQEDTSTVYVNTDYNYKHQSTLRLQEIEYSDFAWDEGVSEEVEHSRVRMRSHGSPHVRRWSWRTEMKASTENFREAEENNERMTVGKNWSLDDLGSQHTHTHARALSSKITENGGRKKITFECHQFSDRRRQDRRLQIPPCFPQEPTKRNREIALPWSTLSFKSDSLAIPDDSFRENKWVFGVTFIKSLHRWTQV
jgi:hypothetical protein